MDWDRPEEELEDDGTRSPEDAEESQTKSSGSVRTYAGWTAGALAATAAVGASGDARIQGDMLLKVIGMTGAWWVLGWMFFYEGWRQHILTGIVTGCSAASAMALVQMGCR